MNNKKFIITIIILAVIVAAVSFFAVNEARKNKEMSQLFAVEKQEMEIENRTCRIEKLRNADRLPEQNQCCLDAGKSGSKEQI